MKRFTESTKWADPWFRKLEIEAKMLWLWLLDNCDCAGIIEPDMDLARFQIGASKDLQRTLDELGDRIEWRGSKLFIPKFSTYQYGANLNPENKAHRGVLNRLAEIECFPSMPNKTKDLQSPLEGATKGLISPPSTRIGVRVGEREGTRERKSEPKGSMEELMKYAEEIGLPPSDGASMFDHWESNGWKNGNNPCKDWKAGMRKWKSQGWMPSQKYGYKPPQTQTGQVTYTGPDGLIYKFVK